jgi:hypothetical protein
VLQVFSLHDTRQLRALLARVGFAEATAEPRTKALALAPPTEFFWQYLHSTPFAAAAAEADKAALAALERDIAARWEPFTHDDGLMLEPRVVTASAPDNIEHRDLLSGAASAPSIDRAQNPPAKPTAHPAVRAPTGADLCVSAPPAKPP